MNHSEADAHFSCTMNHKLLLRITRLRDALGEIEKSIQQKHLNCCIFPGFHGRPEVALAVHELAQKRIGALIVLEQEIGLSEYIRSGTVLNAELSTSLLLSLFYPGNPLHDGAVIIRGSSVVAAGCVLPLSADHELFKRKSTGMRHRAGVGLSRLTDAVVLIVSEETGTISMATAGQLFKINVAAGRGSMTSWPDNITTSDNVSVH